MELSIEIPDYRKIKSGQQATWASGDYAVIVDASLAPLFAKVLPHAETIKHVIVSGGAAVDEGVLGITAHPDPDPPR